MFQKLFHLFSSLLSLLHTNFRLFPPCPTSYNFIFPLTLSRAPKQCHHYLMFWYFKPMIIWCFFFEPGQKEVLQYCKSPIISLLFTISWLCCPQFSTEHLNSLGSNFNVNGLTLQLKSLRRLSLVYRGGQLTSLDASFARCFAFWRTSSKNIDVNFFCKNIAKTLHR